MGLGKNNIRFLLYLKKNGIINFNTTAQMGRNNLYLSYEELLLLFNRFYYFPTPNQLGIDIHIKKHVAQYAENIFKYLGAKEVDTYDFSNYEGANIIHDMNHRVDAIHESKYSLVIDSGTLEHIFNFPTAIHNCMKMLKIGGCFVAMTPANNFCGHGFYQFSPELFYNLFSTQNGFNPTKMIVCEDRKNPKFYNVSDPSIIRERVILENIYPTYIYFVAKKENDVTGLTYPQQSDYILTWNGSCYSHNYGFVNSVSAKIKRNILRYIYEVLVKPYNNKLHFNETFLEIH